MVDYVTLLGLAAGVFTTFSFVPQIIRSVRRKSTKDISWYFLFLWLAGFGLWFVYGIIIGSVPLIVWNSVSFLIAAAMSALKLKYG